MPARKWALEEPLTFSQAQHLGNRCDPKIGASLGWGGLKLFPVHRSGHTAPKSYQIKKGCVVFLDLYEDRVALLSGGYRSDLSFRFLSANSPLPLRESGQDWFLLRPGLRTLPILFVDGMLLGKNWASPCLPWTPASGTSPADSVRTVFTEYIDYVCDHAMRHKVEYPCAAGCWECYFYSTEIIEGVRLPRGCEPNGVTHLFQHAARREIEPSLIWRAVKENGLKPEHHWDKLMGNSKLHPEADTVALRDHLYSFFRRRFGQLGAYQLWASAREKQTDDIQPSEDDPNCVGPTTP